jgi:trans-aconitate 2-methyltransferase
MTWSAKQYTQFESERTRPVRDLVAAIPEGPVRTAVDLGCGPGNSTEVLAGRYPEARVTGLDSSEDMLASARKRLPDLNFELADIQSWRPAQRYDAIVANAVLQWLPDHDTLYPQLLACLNEGGSLAVQTPDNLEEPSHRLMRAVAAESPWADKMAQAPHPPRHELRWYYELLKPHCSRLDVWRTTYFHALAGGPSAIVEWFKGSALQPYLAPLSTDERAEFLRRYEARIAQAYPAMADGTVLLPFPRIFIVATR